MNSTSVLLGLGSNVGDRLAYLQAAFEALQEPLQTSVTSAVYETPPWGIEAQGAFLNLVVRGTTDRSPKALFRFCKAVEKHLGRIPRERYGPREIDIDILAYGDKVSDDALLQIPHPQIAKRAFVLIPLLELVPEWKEPRSGELGKTLLRRLQETEPAVATHFAPPLLSTTSR